MLQLADDMLAAEASAFARYLVGREPPSELVSRYSAASRTLFTARVPPEEAAVVAFARRHPWSVCLLDAAAGLRHRSSLLRNKLLVMAAILETSPEFVDEFLAQPAQPVMLGLRVVALGGLAVLHAVVGLLLYPIAARSRA